MSPSEPPAKQMASRAVGKSWQRTTFSSVLRSVYRTAKCWSTSAPLRLPLPPQAYVHHEEIAAEGRHVPRLHRDPLPVLPHLLPLAPHAVATSEPGHAGEDGRHVELRVLGIHVFHEVEVAVVPALEPALQALDEMR